MLEFIRLLSVDIHAETFGLNSFSNTMDTTLMLKRIDVVDGCVELTVAVRHQLGLTPEVVRQRLEAAALAKGFALIQMEEKVKPYLHDENWPLLQKMAEVANSVTGENAKPHIMGGITYGHLLPNAIVYGTDANVIPEDFPEGYGVAHGLDESASIDRLQRAMRIYARALLALNEMKW